MQAKDKAKELVEKFHNILNINQSTFWDAEKYEQAKQCALICVDEIIDAMYIENRGNPFWQEVKQEINRL